MGTLYLLEKFIHTYMHTHIVQELHGTVPLLSLYNIHINYGNMYGQKAEVMSKGNQSGCV